MLFKKLVNHKDRLVRKQGTTTFITGAYPTTLRHGILASGWAGLTPHPVSLNIQNEADNKAQEMFHPVLATGVKKH